MKVLQLREVQVVRHATTKAALEACFGKVWPHRWAIHPLDEELPEMLDQPLLGAFQAAVYRATLGYVDIDTPMTEKQFRHELERIEPHVFHLASISEGLSYLSRLRDLKIPQEKGVRVLHLGTNLQTVAYYERRLITSQDGVPTLIPYMSGKVLPAPVRIIVVKVPAEK